jgi:hypothetical protein
VLESDNVFFHSFDDFNAGSHFRQASFNLSPTIEPFSAEDHSRQASFNLSHPAGFFNAEDSLQEQQDLLNSPQLHNNDWHADKKVWKEEMMPATQRPTTQLPATQSFANKLDKPAFLSMPGKINLFDISDPVFYSP